MFFMLYHSHSQLLRRKKKCNSVSTYLNVIAYQLLTVRCQNKTNNLLFEYAVNVSVHTSGVMFDVLCVLIHLVIVIWYGMVYIIRCLIEGVPKHIIKRQTHTHHYQAVRK